MIMRPVKPAQSIAHAPGTFPRPVWRWLSPATVVGALIVGALLISLLLPKGGAPGAAHTDLVGQFVAWRAFAVESIRSGDFPFWNPHTYSGQPFLGGFQSALLYPPNLIFLVLPLSRALTFSVLLHLILLGWGVAHWARQRGHGWPGAAVAGVALAGSGAVFPHVYAGHLSNLCTMAWAPWLFAAIEEVCAGRRLKGWLLGSAAVALQILAGQVQYVFLLGVAAGLHAVLLTLRDGRGHRWALPGLALLVLGGCALAAAQLLPGLAAAGEGVRQGRIAYAFAGSFAFPPENFVTAFAPGFFGHTLESATAYWGRGYPWEMSIFLGVAGVTLAIGGAILRPRSRWDLAVAGLLILLALGRHLPLHRWLYDYVPGFGSFRGMSKFMFPALLFVAMALAAGADALLRGEWPLRRAGRVLLAVAAVLAAAALAIGLQPGAVAVIGEWIRERAAEELIAPHPFPASAAAQAAAALGQAAVLSAVLGGALLLATRRRGFRWVPLLLLPLEVLHFAAAQWAVTPVSAAMPDELRRFVAQNPGDYRVLNLVRPNNGFLLGAGDVWGNDPGVLKRYAEFMTFAQGQNPDAATQNLAFTRVHPIHAMLRLRYAFTPTEAGVQVTQLADPLPRVLLASEHVVRTGRDEVFAALIAADFNPRRRVILEQEPSPTPGPAVAGEGGTVRILGQTSDSLILEAETAAPALLVMTELYSRDWRARALPGSEQTQYAVLPANYILRAVPLAAGRHRIAVEYVPTGWRLGLLISAAAWLAWAGALWRARRWRAIA